ncbi:MAG: flagellar filament capping protein FliD [Betaproteobacteria bacterium]|nr:flagellar filament capping protein FliD [Betaproteobacteria bacterium]
MALTAGSTVGTTTTGAITSPGIGSGLDVNTIVSKLMSIEQRPLALLDQKQSSYQTDLSAFGTLNSLFAAFQGAMKNLSAAASYQGLTAGSSDPSIFTGSAATTATPGSYTVSVANIAQTQVLAATGILSAQSASSTGTLTIKVGSGTAAAVTIDASNNTLEGVRDAINAAGAGVTASVVNDGSASPYKLVLTANATGTSNTIQITNNLAAGELHDTIASLAEARAGADATLTVNGVTVKSASNAVTTVIPGITLNLIKSGASTLTVARDNAALQAAVGAFVNAYNNVNSTLGSLTGYNATTKQGGPLLGDSAAQNLQVQVRSILSRAVAGTGGSLTTLSQIGVSFQKEGSLAVDATKLTNGINTNFSGIAALFSVQGKSSSSFLSFAGAGAHAVAGDYQVNITAAATQAAASAGAAPAGSTVIDGTNDGLSLNINGTASGALTLAHGTYTPAQLASAVQSALTAAGAAATVTLDSGKLVIASKDFGAASSIAGIAGTAISALGYSGGESGTGSDVAGSFMHNGVTYAATGSGRILTASSGSAADGIKVQYTGTPAQLAANNSVTLNYAEGYASLLNKFATNVLDPAGPLAGRTAGLNSSIKSLDSQRAAVNRRLTQIEANYRAQFAALDTMVSSLNQTSSFLTQQLANLTASTK